MSPVQRYVAVLFSALSPNIASGRFCVRARGKTPRMMRSISSISSISTTERAEIHGQPCQASLHPTIITPTSASRRVEESHKRLLRRRQISRQSSGLNFGLVSGTRAFCRAWLEVIDTDSALPPHIRRGLCVSPYLSISFSHSILHFAAARSTSRTNRHLPAPQPPSSPGLSSCYFLSF